MLTADAELEAAFFLRMSWLMSGGGDVVASVAPERTAAEMVATAEAVTVAATAAATAAVVAVEEEAAATLTPRCGDASSILAVCYMSRSKGVANQPCYEPAIAAAAQRHSSAIRAFSAFTAGASVSTLQTDRSAQPPP